MLTAHKSIHNEYDISIRYKMYTSTAWLNLYKYSMVRHRSNILYYMDMYGLVQVYVEVSTSS